MKVFGGIIVYIDNSGYHGYVMAKPELWREDLKLVNLTGIENLDTTNDKDTYSIDDFSDGLVATLALKEYYNGIGISVPAIDYILDLNTSGYDDWYMMSNFEWSDLDDYLQATTDSLFYQRFLNDWIWTSTSVSSNRQLDDSKHQVRRITTSNNSSTTTYDIDRTAIAAPLRKF